MDLWGGVRPGRDLFWRFVIKAQTFEEKKRNKENMNERRTWRLGFFGWMVYMFAGEISFMIDENDAKGNFPFELRLIAD